MVVSRWLSMPIESICEAERSCAVEELGERPDLREEDVLRVVLDPSRMREDLLERPLHAVDHAPLAVDEHGAR
jgi:hypothetical protein